MLQHRIALPNIELPPETEADVRERIAGLGRYYERITSCVVTIDVPRRRRKSDALQYRVRIDLVVPGGELVINRQPDNELRTAVQDAFAAARRRLQDYARRLNGVAKTHEPQPVGRVSQYYPLGGYGFIEDTEGREIYFDRNSVLNGAFEQLDVGSEVHFSEEAGDQGPQATTVARAATHRSALHS
jgi:cold shock CspA family protein/ribosome-associated translation inhibitor RaiA